MSQENQPNSARAHLWKAVKASVFFVFAMGMLQSCSGVHPVLTGLTIFLMVFFALHAIISLILSCAE